jgi:tetratricopeptide (TPR) repeat protein
MTTLTSFSGNKSLNSANFNDTIANTHMESVDFFYVSDTNSKKDPAFIIAKANELNIAGFLIEIEGDRDKALNYFQQSLITYKTIDNKEGVANSLYNIGNIYDEQNKLENALNSYSESFKMYKSIGNKRGIAKSLISIGNIYDKQDDLESPLTDYEKSLKIEESIGDKKGIASDLDNIGTVLLQENNPIQALKYAKNSLEKSEEEGSFEAIANADLLLAEVNSTMGNTKSALKFFRQYIIFRDSLVNEQTRGLAVKKQMQNDFDKKQAVVIAEHKKILESQYIIAKEKSKKQKNALMTVIGGFVGLLVFAGFVFRALKITRRQKKIIEIKNKEITDSIRYAKRIQLSLLPTDIYIDKILKRLLKDKTD